MRIFVLFTLMMLESPLLHDYYETVEDMTQGNLDHMDYINERYGFRVDPASLHQGDPKWLTRAEAPNQSDLTNALAMLSLELPKYSPGYLRTIKLRNLRLVANLERRPYFFKPIKRKSVWKPKSESIGGTVADLSSGIVYLAINEVPLDQLAKTFHHELWHQSDFAFTPGRNNRVKKRRFWGPDPRWTDCHPDGEDSYSDEEYAEYESRTNSDDLFENIIPAGFVDSYGRRNKPEDRATIAELLFGDPESVYNLRATDDIVDKKLDEIIRRFSVRSNGVMNREWFENQMIYLY